MNNKIEASEHPKEATAASEMSKSETGLFEHEEFFHAPNGDSYASVKFKGHVETWPIASADFKRLIEYQYFVTYKMPIEKKELKELVALVDAKARFEGPQRKVFTRIGCGDDGSIVIDLANPNWQAVVITKQDWLVVDRSPVPLIRKQGMMPLPVPERGGDISLLDEHLNLAGSEDRILFLSMLLGSFHPNGPFPIVLIAGEQGSGKSTLCRIARALVDPSEAPVTTLPRDERNLHIAASKSWMQVYDNVSKIKPDFSDSLCRLATGAGLRRRKLTTDDVEMIFSSCRPVILNSIIQGLIEANDLADRALIVRTKSLGDASKTAEESLNCKFEKNKPLIFGALLTGVSVALKNLPDVSTSGLPRMADFARWCIAGETGLGLELGSFMRAYEANRTLITGSAVDASPIHEPILNTVRETGYWKGDVKSLYGELLRRRSFDGDTWPKNHRALLDRIIPGLRREGIGIKFLGRDGYTRRSVLEIRVVNNNIVDAAHEPVRNEGAVSNLVI
jgi:energy-coupling factor transporter ATP-binding protein EcfA2